MSRAPSAEDPEGAVLRGRKISALDLSRRSRAQDRFRSATNGGRCRIRCASGWKSRNGARWCRGRAQLLVETFPRGNRYYLVCYPFEGRLAHQTLGMLLTRRLERARLRPLGFVANEYALAVWGLGDVACDIERGELSLATLFDEDMLGDDLEAWLAESALMKRTFRTCAIIAGLIERRFPGKEKSRREVTISTDLVYDVLRRHQPDHILLRAARADAATGLLDIRRLGDMLARIKGRIIHRALDHVSPLAVPVMLEIGRETVYGEASERAAGGSRGRTREGGDAVIMGVTR